MFSVILLNDQDVQRLAGGVTVVRYTRVQSGGGTQSAALTVNGRVIEPGVTVIGGETPPETPPEMVTRKNTRKWAF